MEKEKNKIIFLYNWDVMIKKGQKWHLHYLHCSENNTILGMNEAKHIFKKPQQMTHEDDQSRIRNYHLKLLTTINCDRTWTNQLLQEYILIGLILLLDSIEDMEGFSSLQVVHSATCSDYPQLICLHSFIGIFYEIWTPKLKASLTSTDTIVATISSCQGIKVCSIHYYCFGDSFF